MIRRRQALSPTPPCIQAIIPHSQPSSPEPSILKHSPSSAI
ncbi:hypothetical protein [uncultured Duncaniella sp.]|nr:hypothetical protein [uncultured Duncaniella sp.]